MASFVNAADAIAAAVEIEKRGYKFYEKAANRSSNLVAKEFFGYMASEELKHEKIFEAMLERIGGLDLPGGSNEQEYLDYVQATLDSHLLFMPGEKIDEQNPFEVAMRFEKDTIIYFMAMLDLVPQNEKKYVQDCIEEEKKHMRLIAAKQKEMNNLN